MKLNNYNNTLSSFYTNQDKYIKAKSQDNIDNTTQENKQLETNGVIYEKSNNIKDTTQSNEDIITKLQFETEQRTNQLYNLVQKMFNKQGITFNTSNEMFNILRSGNFKADPETIAQAKEDISEDGYWGVKQTSDRLVSFAQALSGNDPEKADKMIAAVKKGFDQASKTWGGELPSICKDTLDTTVKKLEDWRDSITSSPTQTTNESTKQV
jgi:hypothetical protein